MLIAHCLRHGGGSPDTLSLLRFASVCGDRDRVGDSAGYVQGSGGELLSQVSLHLASSFRLA